MRGDNPCDYAYIGIVVKALDDEVQGIHVEWRNLKSTTWHVKDVLFMYLCITVQQCVC